MKNIHHWLVIVFGIVGGAAFLAIIIIVMANATIRLFGRGIPGDIELVQMGAGAGVIISLCYTTLAKGHVSVDLLLKLLPKKVQKFVILVNALIAIGFWIIMAYSAFIMVNDNIGFRDVTHILQLSLTPLRMLLFIGVSLISLILVTHSVRFFLGYTTNLFTGE